MGDLEKQGLVGEEKQGLVGKLEKQALVGKRALVVRSGALGDTIVSFPGVAALVRCGYTVELVGRPPAHELAVRPGLAVRSHSIDRMPGRALYVEGHPEAEALLRRFSAVVAWSDVPAFVRTARAADLAVVDGPYRAPRGRHVSDSLLESLVPLGVRPDAAASVVSLRPEPDDVVHATSELGLEATDYLAIHPSSGSPSKNWPPAQFGELARLAVDAGLRVVWLQGEADEAVVGPLRDVVPGVLVRNAALRSLLAVLAGATLYVGNDSGVSHMAAAAGASTFAVFRASDPVVWAPRGPRVTIVDASHTARHLWGIAYASLSRG